MKKREREREEREDDAHRVVTRKAYTLENKQGEGKGRRWAWMFIQKIADTTGNAGRTKGGKGKGKREGTMSVVKKKRKKERKKIKGEKEERKKREATGKRSSPFLSLSLFLSVSFSFPSLLRRYSLSAGVKSVEMRRRWECGLCDSRERRWSKNRNSGGL